MTNIIPSFPDLDFILPLGAACRPAHALHKNDLRFFSSPFDWMMSYSLQSVIDLFDTQFSTFFKSYEILSKNKNNYIVKDRNNGMVAMHAFPANREVAEYHPVFIKKMLNRFNRLQWHISNAQKFAIISNRENAQQEIVDFIHLFSDLTRRPFIYINIEDNQRESVTRTEIDSNHFLYNVSFNDVHPLGADKKSNPDFWVGNELKWRDTLSHLSLRDKPPHSLQGNITMNFSNQPLLTVIVTAWRATHCLEATLTYMRREMDMAKLEGINSKVLIAIDNCHETCNLAYELKNRFDNRFEFFMADANVGTYVLKNSILKNLEALDTLLYFFDADDIITPRFLIDGYKYFFKILKEEGIQDLILRPPYLCIPDYLMPAVSECYIQKMEEALTRAKDFIINLQPELAIPEVIKCLMAYYKDNRYYGMLLNLVRLCLYRGEMINGLDSRDLDYGLRDAYSQFFILASTLERMGGYNEFRVGQDSDLLDRAKKLRIRMAANRALPYFIRIMSNSMATRGPLSIRSANRQRIRAQNARWIEEGRLVAPCKTVRVQKI